VDGVFIGPADLSASFGYLGQSSHPEMQKIILDALRRISASGKAAGILTADDTFIQASLDAGARFVAVAMDIACLLNSARAVADKWKSNAE
jgi:4-hydroxy-2-oxoheptanedioate aldolase